MFLALASLYLLIIIAIQNYLYPPLREETVSDGLYGPYHWWLDGAYLILIAAIESTFIGTKGQFPAIIAGLALLITAISNTFSEFIDRLTGGAHVKIHTWFSIIMFLSMLALEVIMNQSVSLWFLSAAGVILPIAVYGLCQIKSLKTAGGPAAEKTAVALLCIWLIVWGLLSLN